MFTVEALPRSFYKKNWSADYLIYVVYMQSKLEHLKLYSLAHIIYYEIL